jgi:hypothetical protein
MQRESDNRRREMKDKGANYPPVSPGIISNSEALETGRRPVSTQFHRIPKQWANPPARLRSSRNQVTQTLAQLVRRTRHWRAQFVADQSLAR